MVSDQHFIDKLRGDKFDGLIEDKAIFAKLNNPSIHVTINNSCCMQ